MTTVFSSNVRDLVSRYHRDVLSLRARLAQERSAAHTSVYNPREAQIQIGATQMDACDNLKVALKKLQETFIRSVQNQLQSERELELKQLEADFEEEVLSITAQYEAQHSQQSSNTAVARLSVATGISSNVPTTKEAETYSSTSALVPPQQFGPKMSLLPLKPDPKSKTSKQKNKSIATTTTTVTTTAPAAAAVDSAVTYSSTSAAGAGGDAGTTTTPHPSDLKSSRLCNRARDALNEAKRLGVVGAYAKSAAAFRNAGKIQDTYNYRNSIPKNPRLHYGGDATMTAVGQRRSANQRLINASQRGVFKSEVEEKQLNDSIEEIRKRYMNALERLRHRHTVEQHAAVSLAQLAMSAPAEEKHCSALQRKLQKKNSANNVAGSNEGMEADVSGVNIIGDPDEMYTPYRKVGDRWGAGGLGAKAPPASMRLSPALLGRPLSSASVRPTSVTAPSAVSRNMYGAVIVQQHRPLTSAGSDEGGYYYNSRPPTAASRVSRGSPSRARSPFALHSTEAHATATAGHNVAVVATSGSVLDGVAAPPPFGTRPPSSKVASGTTTSSGSSHRRHLLPRPQSAGGGGGVGGLSRPQTAQARLGLIPTHHAPSTTTTPSSLVALCDAYGDLFVDEDADDDDNLPQEGGGGDDDRNFTSSSAPSNPLYHHARARSATSESGTRSGPRHNPRVNVTGTRYLQAVASRNRLYNYNNTSNNTLGIYEE